MLCSCFAVWLLWCLCKDSADSVQRQLDFSFQVTRMKLTWDKMRQVPIIFVLSLSSWVSPYCWVPNNNPFTGPPDTQRLEGSTTGQWFSKIKIGQLSLANVVINIFSSCDLGEGVPPRSWMWWSGVLDKISSFGLSIQLQTIRSDTEG